MTALSAGATRRVRGAFQKRLYPVNATSQIWEGGLVTIDATGNAIAGVDTASTACVGVAEHDALGGASDGLVNVTVLSGADWLFTATSITQAMVNITVMVVVDDNTVDDIAGATNDIQVGTLVEFNSTTSGWVSIPPAGTGSALA